MTVVDASLLIDTLVGLPAGRPWRRWLAERGHVLAAPDIVCAELGRYLRRHTLTGVLTAADAEGSLLAFHELGIGIYPSLPLLADAFALRHNFTFDDALYVALARLLNEPLATTDSRLARAVLTVGVRVERLED